MNDPQDILHSQPPGRKPLPGGPDGDDDDRTYDEDEWQDMEDDRDPRNLDKAHDYLASLERRGYFI
jgi:hypothetical protein